MWSFRPAFLLAVSRADRFRARGRTLQDAAERRKTERAPSTRARLEARCSAQSTGSNKLDRRHSRACVAQATRSAPGVRQPCSSLRQPSADVALPGKVGGKPGGTVLPPLPATG